MIPFHPTNDVWYETDTHWGGYDGSALLVWPSVADAGVTISTDAGRVVFRSGVTSVLAHIDIDTVAARVVLRSGDTSVVTGQVSIDTVAGRVVFRAADSSILASALIDTDAARLVLRAAVTSVVGGGVIVLVPPECMVIMAPTVTCVTHGPVAEWEII